MLGIPLVFFIFGRADASIPGPFIHQKFRVQSCNQPSIKGETKSLSRLVSLDSIDRGLSNLSNTVSCTSNSPESFKFIDTEASFSNPPGHLNFLPLTCGAFIAPTVWREFMCYNLGSVYTGSDSVRLFTPSWEINGGYWQWGKKAMAAPGPKGPDIKNANDGAIAGWNQDIASNLSWNDSIKTVDDPCPSGYRVPTRAEWEGVIATNKISGVGISWSSGPTNYGSGKRFGNYLFLPSAGYRVKRDGSLNFRGELGSYWSSTGNVSEGARNLYFMDNDVLTLNSHRADGLSLRCISEQVGLGLAKTDVSTNQPRIITSATAVGGGSVTSARGLEIIARGVVWSTRSNPEITLTTRTADGIGNGDFTSQITGLQPKTTYYIRAYATSNTTITYGNELVFTTPDLTVALSNDWVTTSPELRAVQSSEFTCGAYIAPGEWRQFMCYNLGAAYTGNDSARLFTPSWEINGGYWQWGRKEISANGPSGQSAQESNAMAIAGWSYYAPEGAWNDQIKTVNDPCPSGFRLPTKEEWEGIIENNPKREVGGFWKEGVTNFSSGIKFGNSLFLPASGFRSENDGTLMNRGIYGNYWSSTDCYQYFGYIINFFKLNAIIDKEYRSSGLSVRCISDNSELPTNLPVILTNNISSATPSSVLGGGTIAENDDIQILVRGVVWSTKSSPEVSLLTRTIDGFGTGSFASQINNLSANTTYYVRAYAVTNSGTLYGNEVVFKTPSAEPGFSNKVICGAYIAPGEWREFMCYNLGAAYTGNDSARLFTPSWEINGGYWQWGRKEMAAPGPSGLGDDNANDGSIAGWNSNAAPNGSWLDSNKTENDPCPSGFVVPTRKQWEGIIANNPLKFIGSFERETSTNYGSGVLIGNKLLLPHAGLRSHVLQFRGRHGGYWSSTDAIGHYKEELGYHFQFWSNHGDVRTCYRTNGYSVRCISQNKWTGASIPKVSTDEVVINKEGRTVALGTVASDGGAETSRGFVWNTNGKPEVTSASKTVEGTGTGIFQSQIIGLRPNTTYYLRAYATNSMGTVYGREISFLTEPDTRDKVDITICGAFIAPGEWREFLCYNLGAAYIGNDTARLFKPSWENNGGYWQWGRKEMAAPGPSGPDPDQTNEGLIAGWNTSAAEDGSWQDGKKTSNDPCPLGYRLPTKMEFDGLSSNNHRTLIKQAWDTRTTNYCMGMKFGNNLFLQAAGRHVSSLFNLCDYGNYWSSSSTNYLWDRDAWGLHFNNSSFSPGGLTGTSTKTDGQSVRCIAE